MNQTSSNGDAPTIAPSLSPHMDSDRSLGAQLSAMSIGIIVLCILFGFALVVAIWLLFMRKKRHKLPTEHSQQASMAGPSTAPGFKQRIKEHFWHHASDREACTDKRRQSPTVDDLVFSAIQQHLPPHPPPPSQAPPSAHHPHADHHSSHHRHHGDPAMFEEGYSYSTLRGTSTATSHCSKSLPPDDPILQSLARQREFDRAGYYKGRTSAVDRDEEEAMLQRLSMSSYHVW